MSLNLKELVEVLGVVPKEEQNKRACFGAWTQCLVACRLFLSALETFFFFFGAQSVVKSLESVNH